MCGGKAHVYIADNVKIMASSIGNSAASAIVEADTLQLISQADSIVQSCVGGPGCNTSPQTRALIKQTLSETAQADARETLRLLSVPASSVTGRNIYDGYIALAASVSSVYNYQCGDDTTKSTSCVTNSTSVQTAQDNLQSLISQPSIDNTKHIIVLSILLSIAVIAFILFFVFFVIGLVGTAAMAPLAGADYAKSVELQGSVDPTPVQTPMAVPASPFDSTETIYR